MDNINIQTPLDTSNEFNASIDKLKLFNSVFIFSYWIFLWFIIFYVISMISSKIVKNVPNPKLALICAATHNIATVGAFISYETNIIIIIKYVIGLITIKIIPLILLLYQESQIHLLRDSIILAVLFIIYNIYLFINDTNIIEIYTNIFDDIKNGGKNVPFFNILNKIF